MQMGRFFFTSAVLLGSAVFADAPATIPASAGCCGQRMTIAGDARYYAPKGNKTATGAAIPEQDVAEVYGKTLVLTAELPAGQYTVEVEGSENSYARPNSRLFDVLVNKKLLAHGVDLYKLAGRDGAAATVKGTVDHPGGPMKIELMALLDNAKFSVVHVLDAQGNKVAWALAADMKDVEKDEVPPILEGPAIWKDSSVDMESRVTDLMRRMTLREKVGQMMYQAPAIERLGIPTYNYWNECLHGVARNGNATVFPEPIGMAASFDPELLHTVADAISTEGRAKYEDSSSRGERGIYQGLNFWTPNINIFRDPRWGRGQETYGEDPFLTSRMGVAFITGLQGTDPKYLKVIATAKHFAVHSGPEKLRHVFDAQPPEQDLYETYLPQFEAAVREGHVYSVMGAYNRLYGSPATASPLLLEDLLRDRWGFKGFIVSDCWAIDDIWANHKVVQTRAEAAAMAVKTGTDLECGGDYASLIAAVDLGLINEREIDTAVMRVMLARMKLGLFDPPSKVPFTKIAKTDFDTPAHAELSLKMARESLVLLKNDGILPLKKTLKKIAVVGPNGDSLLPLLGNYNGTATRITTVAEGLKKMFPEAKIVSLRGCDVSTRPGNWHLVSDGVLEADGKAGLHAEYFDNLNLQGKPYLVRQDSGIDFNGPIEWTEAHTNGKKGSARWTGEFVAPADGKYRLIVGAPPAGAPMGHRVWINNRLVDDRWNEEDGKMADPLVELAAGQRVPIKVECQHTGSYLGMELLWEHADSDAIPQVVARVKDADVVVFVSGFDGRVEAEEGDIRAVFDGFPGGDRDAIELPAPQVALYKALAETKLPLVLVNMTGSAVAMPEEVAGANAVLQAWYPGQAGGQAVAEVLAGQLNPSGKLPITFYASTKDLPAFTDYDMHAGAGRTYRYFTGKPLFAFGQGLSYTRFEYGRAAVESAAQAGEAFMVSLDVTNSGAVDGDEVVQVYVRRPESVPNAPIRQLVGFQRVSIGAGKTVHVRIPVRELELRYWDVHNKEYAVAAGDYVIEVGAGSADIRQMVTYTRVAK